MPFAELSTVSVNKKKCLVKSGKDIVKSGKDACKINKYYGRTSIEPLNGAERIMNETCLNTSFSERFLNGNEREDKRLTEIERK